MATKTREKLEAKEAIVIVVGARPPEWPRKIVRDRHTGKLVEVVLNELDPIDPGSEGIAYAFKAGEKVWSDHPAAIDCPSAFIPVSESANA